MAMTVRRLAHRADLGMTLVAGRDAWHREITWAHAIELPDPSPYLSGGELVMTTGMNVGRTHDEQFAYMARLAAGGVAALAFDTGTTFTQVPAGIIGAGDALSLPVFAVPARTPFIAITRAVIDAVNTDELCETRNVIKQQETLVRETLRKGFPAVVNALADVLAATVVVTNHDGALLASAGPDAPRIALVTSKSAGHTGRLTQARPSAGRVVPDGEGYCAVQPGA